MKKNIVIFGGNRGIGLELVRQYAASGDDVTVFCRKPSKELEKLNVQVISEVDVKEDLVISKIASQIAYKKIDIFIHNSGILVGDTFPEISLDAMRESFEVNTLGPLKTILALKDKLVKGSKIGIVSSRVGSISDNSSSDNYAYRTSKTAVNMIGKCLSLDLKERGITVALLHPGYVRTDMTGGNGLINPDESAKGLITRMKELNLENTGHFVHASGEELIW